MIEYTDQLLAQLKKLEDKPANVTDWFNFYSFDVMGDLAWGKSFGMLRDGVKHYFMNSLHASMINVGVLSHLMWFFPLFKALPILNYEYNMFWKWVTAQVEERKEVCQCQVPLFRQSKRLIVGLDDSGPSGHFLVAH